MPTTTTTLQAQAEQHATTEHARRMAEIKAMAPLLAQLDALLPQLGEHGLIVDVTDMRLQRVLGYGPHGRKALRINTGATFMAWQLVRLWYAALVALGFAEVHRTDSAYFPLALMRLGTLLLLVDVPPPAPATMGAAPAPFPTAQAA